MQRLNDWEDISFRVSQDGSVILGNSTGREITGTVVSFNGEDIDIPVLEAHSVTRVEHKANHSKGGQNAHSAGKR